MLRLLQGDVGSGKTIEAVFACLQAIENGFQAAIMTPTEILAYQHLQSFTNYLNIFNRRGSHH
jgi:ATP-dependent DNA helicase RecG